MTPSSHRSGKVRGYLELVAQCWDGGECVTGPVDSRCLSPALSCAWSSIYSLVCWCGSGCLGLHRSARASLAESALVVVCGLLIAVASTLWNAGSTVPRFSSCGKWAQLPHGMWDLPGPGINPVPLALAGRLPTTGPLEKLLCLLLTLRYSWKVITTFHEFF